MVFLRVLFIVWLVLSLNCFLTLVCKLTYGTRPRDAGIIFRGAVAADGCRKFSYLEVHCFILLRRPCPGSARYRLWLVCGSHVVSDDFWGAAKIKTGVPTQTETKTQTQTKTKVSTDSMAPRQNTEVPY